MATEWKRGDTEGVYTLTRGALKAVVTRRYGRWDATIYAPPGHVLPVSPPITGYGTAMLAKARAEHEVDRAIREHPTAYGAARSRPPHPRTRAERLVIAKELARRRAAARKQKRNTLGLFQ